MTLYLVKHINEVKRNIDEIASGNLSIYISEFGYNCAGRLISGINKLSSEITSLVLDIRQTSLSARHLSNNLLSQSANLSVKTEQQSLMLIETAASMEQISVGTKNNVESASKLSEIAINAHRSANHSSHLM